MEPRDERFQKFLDCLQFICHMPNDGVGDAIRRAFTLQRKCPWLADDEIVSAVEFVKGQTAQGVES